MRFALIVPFLAAATNVVAADALQWNWAKSFYVECELTTVSDFKLPKAAKSTAESRCLLKVTPEIGKEGVVRLKHEIVAFKISKETDEQKTENKMFSKLAGGAFTVTRAKNGALSKFEGGTALVQRTLGNVLDGDEKKMRAMTSLFETMLDSCVGEAYFPLPEKADAPVRSEQKLSMAGIASLELKRKYTLIGSGEEAGRTVHRYKMTADTKLTVSDEESALLPFKFTEMKAKTPFKYGSEMTFDAARGIPVQVVVKSSGELQATAETDNGTLKIEGTEERTLVIRFSDKAPVVEKK